MEPKNIDIAATRYVLLVLLAREKRKEDSDHAELDRSMDALLNISDEEFQNMIHVVDASNAQT